VRSFERARALVERLCTPEVSAHCAAVEVLACRIATELSSSFNVDVNAVRCGAVLHDIGRAYTHSIAHGVIGACIARKFGFDEDICLIIERHIGGGIDKKEAERLGLPPDDYTPKTLEEKIVAHADNLTDDTEYVSVDGAISDMKEKGVPESVILKVAELAEEVEALRAVASREGGTRKQV